MFFEKKSRKPISFRGKDTPGRFKGTWITFSYPDYTVGPGVSPDPAPNQALAGCTADWELLALTLPRRFILLSNQSILSPNPDVNKGNFNRSLKITLVCDLNHNSSVGHQGCYRANRR